MNPKIYLQQQIESVEITEIQIKQLKFGNEVAKKLTSEDLRASNILSQSPDSPPPHLSPSISSETLSLFPAFNTDKFNLYYHPYIC